MCCHGVDCQRIGLSVKYVKSTVDNMWSTRPQVNSLRLGLGLLLWLGVGQQSELRLGLSLKLGLWVRARDMLTLGTSWLGNALTRGRVDCKPVSV